MEAIPEELSVDSMQGYVDTAVDLVITEGPQIILAILVAFPQISLFLVR